MPKSRKSIANQRTHAFQIQKGLCYYCKLPMWKNDPTEIISSKKLTKNAKNLLQCTGEHLTPHSEGGSVRRSNIVAACKYCNMSRHRRKKSLSHVEYSNLVSSRMKKGKWISGLFV